MSAEGTPWALALLAWVLLIAGVATENMPALWAAMILGAAALAELWRLTCRGGQR